MKLTSFSKKQQPTLHSPRLVRARHFIPIFLILILGITLINAEEYTMQDYELDYNNAIKIMNNSQSLLLQPCSQIGAEIYYSNSTSKDIIVKSCKLNNQSIIQIHLNSSYSKILEYLLNDSKTWKKDITINLGDSIDYIKDNDTKQFYKIENGIVNIGILEPYETKVLIISDEKEYKSNLSWFQKLLNKLGFKK